MPTTFFVGFNQGFPMGWCVKKMGPVARGRVRLIIFGFLAVAGSKLENYRYNVTPCVAHESCAHSENFPCAGRWGLYRRSDSVVETS